MVPPNCIDDTGLSSRKSITRQPDARLTSWRMPTHSGCWVMSVMIGPSSVVVDGMQHFYSAGGLDSWQCNCDNGRQLLGRRQQHLKSGCPCHCW
uniref:Uncharacterized protein n=1 Tax=Romanomermis culicivorax TaxID=13658 RepID=A0A915IZ31_ROMCU